MATCPYSNEIEAYYDGELEASRRGEVQRHLETCTACAALLEELRGVSRALAQATSGHLSQMGRHRLHMRIEQAMESGVRRTAWMLSGLAASVLVVGSLWLAGRSEDVPQAAPPWVEVSAATTSLGRDTATPAAEWYLAGVFSRGDETP